MHFLQNIQSHINIDKLHMAIHATNKLLTNFPTHLNTNIPFAIVLDSLPNDGIPCNDVFVQLISSGLGAFLYTLMEIGGAIGLICIILGGLLRISALTTQKKEDKDDRMFLSQFSFICAIVVLVPTFIFFILLVLLPNWFGLGNKSCH
jgi:hypothetical protein